MDEPNSDDYTEHVPQPESESAPRSSPLLSGDPVGITGGGMSGEAYDRLCEFTSDLEKLLHDLSEELESMDASSSNGIQEVHAIHAIIIVKLALAHTGETLGIDLLRKHPSLRFEDP